jgi:hypothetical protein
MCSSVHEQIANNAYPCYNTNVMSIHEMDLTGWDGVDDGILSRLQRADIAPAPMAASEDQNTASRHWPLWRGFLYELRGAVDRPAAGEAAALREEAASALRHMATGAFWGDQIGEMHGVDLAGVQKSAGDFVTRYGLQEQTAPSPAPAEAHTPGETTQPIRRVDPGEKTQVIGGRHDVGERTQLIDRPTGDDTHVIRFGAGETTVRLNTGRHRDGGNTYPVRLEQRRRWADLIDSPTAPMPTGPGEETVAINTGDATITIQPASFPEHGGEATQVIPQNDPTRALSLGALINQKV